MGDMADLDDCYYDFDDLMAEGEWVTNDGRVLQITEMSTAHLWNTIKMLRRKGMDDILKFDELIQEHSRRSSDV